MGRRGLTPGGAAARALDAAASGVAGTDPSQPVDEAQRVWRPPGPIARRFMKSGAFFSGIRGPVGSGKSTTCVMQILRRAREMPPSRDGVRRSRWAVIRNTYPELKTTTIPTWHYWVPQHVGEWRDHGPPRHLIRDKDSELEVWFIALDTPADVNKLLSLELTGAWVNEARELPKAIIDGLGPRVGRFPSRQEVGDYWHGVIMDTNSPETDHWWYTLAERDTSTAAGREMVKSLEEAEATLRAAGVIEQGQPLFEFFSQPGGLDPAAENLPNLQPGYYARASAGKRQDWIAVYVHGLYGFVRDGKPVYDEYNDAVHCKAFDIDPRLGLHVGLDFGLTPAAAIGAKDVQDRWLIRWELVTEDMGVVRFGELLAAKLRTLEGLGHKVLSITGDPAGSARGADERTVFDILEAAGLKARPASTNDFMLRREAVAAPMRRLADGGPALLIHPECATLRKGMAGAYCFKRLQVSGEERFRDVPDKTPSSHVCEALQYLMLGGGEGRKLVTAHDRNLAPYQAETDYAVLDH